MMLFRRILQVITGLLFIVVVLAILSAPDPNYGLTLPFLVLFILIILILGPWWPDSANLEKWKLILPTDTPRVAFPLFGVILGLSSFYLAWDTYMHPNQKPNLFMRPIADLFGPEGVSITWVVLGVGCLYEAFRFYKRGKAA